MKSWIKILIALFLLLTLSVTGLILHRLTFDDSLQNWVPPNSEIINDYKTFLNEFNTDALIILSIVDKKDKGRDSFSVTLDSLVKQITRLEHVVTCGKWPPPFLRYKTSPKQNNHSFYITFLPPSHLNPNRPELVQNLRDILQKAGVEYHIAGTGVIHKAINDMTRQGFKALYGNWLKHSDYSIGTFY